MNDQDTEKYFDLIELIKSVSSRWLMLIIFLIAGGLAGYLFGFFRAPLYESNVSFGVTIDYTQTGALSDVQEDQAMRGVGSILLSDPLVAETLSRINPDEGNQLSLDEFRQNAFIDRGDFRWTLRYRGNDPQRVFQIAQKWADTARESFSVALDHAQKAEAYLAILDSLQNCYQSSTTQYPANLCGFKNDNDLLAEINSLSEKIQSEKTASQGLFYALSIYQFGQAELPQNPIRFNTNLLVMAGALTGFLMGVIFLVIFYFRGGRFA